MLNAKSSSVCHRLCPSADGSLLQRKGLSGWHSSALRLRQTFGAGVCQRRHKQRCDWLCSAAKKDTTNKALSSNTDVPVLSENSSSTSSWRWESSDDAIKAYAALLGFLALGLVPELRQIRYIDLPYFVGLASMTIYIGAHRGLGVKVRQQISIKEGALAPFFASGALFAAYLLVKYFPDLNIKTVQNIYFWILGTTSIVGALQKPLRLCAGPLGKKMITKNIPQQLLDDDMLDENGKKLTTVSFAPIDIITLVGAVAAATIDLQNNHLNFTLNNMIACLVASEILQLLGLRSFRTGAVLLAGLLLYDVFWVFGSKSVVGDNVMLTVATSNIISGPTRLLFPRLGKVSAETDFPFSLLGLGDIAVPGLLACLALRYDASRATNMRARADAAAEALKGAFAKLDPAATGRQMAEAAADAAGAAVDRVADAEAKQRSSSDDASTSGAWEAPEAVLQQRTYFVPTMAAYVLGLAIAFGANAITKLGQPALLYLVPATFAAITLTAAVRGEVGRVWQWTDNTSRAPKSLRDKKKDTNDSQ